MNSKLLLVLNMATAFQPLIATTDITLSDLALLSEKEFSEEFKVSRLNMAKWRRLVRNLVLEMPATIVYHADSL